MTDITSPRISVGMILGNDTDRHIEHDRIKTVALRGNNDANLLISLIDDPTIVWSRVQLTPSYFRKRISHNLSGFDVLWNLISDADQHPKVLAVADRLTEGFAGATIDAPSQILGTRRHQVAARLQGIRGVTMPKTLLLRFPNRERLTRQIEQAAFRFPAILRVAGEHNGHVLGLIDGIDGASPIFGDRQREYYLTEFVDVRAADGLYRKSRFFVVGDQIIVRQHIAAPHWNIHGASSRAYMVQHKTLLEEARSLLTGQFAALPLATQQALEGIRGAMKMDYFGIDACIGPDGSLTVFEANATMNFNPAFRNPATQYNRAAVSPMIEATRRLLELRVSERRRG